MQLSTLRRYEFVTVAKLKILVYLQPQRKKGKSYYENRFKAHDAVVITEKYSIFPSLKGEYIALVQIYVNAQRHIYL